MRRQLSEIKFTALILFYTLPSYSDGTGSDTQGYQKVEVVCSQDVLASSDTSALLSAYQTSQRSASSNKLQL